MQTTARSSVIAFSIFTTMCLLYIAARGAYYSERRQTEFTLSEINGISDIRLHTDVEFTEEVNGSSFAVAALPDSIITTGGLSSYKEGGKFSVSRIGKWKFVVAGRNLTGLHKNGDDDSSDPIYLGSSIPLGTDTPYQPLIPFEVKTLQDVVDHYQDLIELFETWPRGSNPGTVTLENGTTEFFYVIDSSLDEGGYSEELLKQLNFSATHP